MQTDKLARSFVLGLSGVVGAYVLQFLTTADLGPYLTPIVAAMTPVAVNYLRMLWAKWFPTDAAGATMVLTAEDLRALLLAQPELVLKDLQIRPGSQKSTDAVIVQ